MFYYTYLNLNYFTSASMLVYTRNFLFSLQKLLEIDEQKPSSRTNAPALVKASMVNPILPGGVESTPQGVFGYNLYTVWGILMKLHDFS